MDAMFNKTEWMQQAFTDSMCPFPGARITGNAKEGFLGGLPLLSAWRIGGKNRMWTAHQEERGFPVKRNTSP